MNYQSENDYDDGEMTTIRYVRMGRIVQGIESIESWITYDLGVMKPIIKAIAFAEWVMPGWQVLSGSTINPDSDA